MSSEAIPFNTFARVASPFASTGLTGSGFQVRRPRWSEPSRWYTGWACGGTASKGPTRCGVVLMAPTLTASVVPQNVVFPLETQLDYDRSWARELGELRRISGLTWEQIAFMLGVSRRSVHNWANGAVVSGVNSERLARTVAVIRSFDTGVARVNRVVLMTPDADGRSPLDLLSEGQYDVARRALGSADTVVRRTMLPRLDVSELRLRRPLPPDVLLSAQEADVPQPRGRSRYVKPTRLPRRDV
jgi:transcriptional regulator with XRE-family HTH domain